MFSSRRRYTRLSRSIARAALLLAASAVLLGADARLAVQAHARAGLQAVLDRAEVVRAEPHRLLRLDEVEQAVEHRQVEQLVLPMLEAVLGVVGGDRWQLGRLRGVTSRGAAPNSGFPAYGATNANPPLQRSQPAHAPSHMHSSSQGCRLVSHQRQQPPGWHVA